MDVRNFTPFSCFRFMSCFPDDRRFNVAVLRGTFDMHDLKLLQISEEQEDVVLVDRHYDEPHKTCLEAASDLVPMKPRADIAVTGHAKAPEAKPHFGWRAGVRVGEHEKVINVYGERYWKYASGSWYLTQPDPCTEVPLRYELAFGGEAPERLFLENPVGMGFVNPRKVQQDDLIAAPRIDSPENPVKTFGRDYRPEGFGWIARNWQPRLTHAGTYDVAWEKNRAPGMPLDFHPGFYNAAHPDLIYHDYLTGNEVVTLENLTTEGMISFQLPCIAPWLFVRHKDGNLQTMPMVLDTLLMDGDTRRVFLTWRYFFKDTVPVRVLEFHMRVPEGVDIGQK